MNSSVKYVLRRLAYLLPQALGVSAVTFVLVRLLPGDPAFAIAGPAASEQALANIRSRMGLDRPLLEQFLLYMRDLTRGDLGTSWVTGNAVTDDLLVRVPATLELITLGLLISLLVGIPIGIIAAIGRGRAAKKGTATYGLLAGAIPDFWLGLILVYVLFYLLGWAPSPLGRLDLAVAAPDRITGFLSVDSLLTGNWPAFRSAVAHLVLPVVTLVFVYMAPIVKMTRSTVEQVYESEFVEYLRLQGLSERTIVRRALKSAMPPVITIVGVLFGFLLGGAVLVESVFSWGGAGQYAVQSIVSSDYAAIQGFVLFAAAFTLVVYLLVDLAYFAVDPRLRN